MYRTASSPTHPSTCTHQFVVAASCAQPAHKDSSPPSRESSSFAVHPTSLGTRSAPLKCLVESLLTGRQLSTPPRHVALLDRTRPVRDAQRQPSMAGSADPNTSLAQRHPSATSPRAPPPRHSLPNGPCNYRDATVGPCGCDQFWDTLSVELHNGSADHHPGGQRSTWCVCRHHACFHSRASRAPEWPAPSVAALLPSIAVESGGLSHGHGQLLPAPQYNVFADSRQVGQEQQVEPQAVGPGRIAQGRDTPAQASTTGLPGIPSVCMLSHDQRPSN